MVLDRSPRLDLVFHALAHPARRAIIRQLSRLEAGGEHNLSELASPLKMTFPAASKHVRVLERAGLVATEKLGRVRTCRLGPRRLENEALWIERYRQLWDARFDELDQVLEDMQRKEKVDGRGKR